MQRYVEIKGQLMQVGEQVVYLGTGGYTASGIGLKTGQPYTIRSISQGDGPETKDSISLEEARGWFYQVEHFRPAKES